MENGVRDREVGMRACGVACGVIFPFVVVNGLLLKSVSCAPFAQRGGVVYAHRTDALLSECNITNVTTFTTGGAADVNGGCVQVREASVRVIGCYVSDVSAATYGRLSNVQGATLHVSKNP
eukprot:219079-Prymnesium_polylepis.1